MSIFSLFRKKKNAETASGEPEVIKENEKEAAKQNDAEMIDQSAEENQTEEILPTEQCALELPDIALDADEVLDSEPEPQLSDMDFSDFWHDIRESERHYEGAKPDLRLIRSVQDELGFKLPDTFIELMKKHNGGMVNRCWYPINFPAETYSDYIQITHLLGIGRETSYSLCGRFGSRFLLEGKGGLENAGIAFANCISPSRAILVLDYRTCGSDGEPCVTYVNSASLEETVIASNFEIFIRGLKTSLEALGQGQ